MNYTIDINLQMPAYLQLYNQIKADIVKGIYPYGSKVPSKRTMAVETGISTITVEHAYALLCEEGYIESRERSGFFVVFRLVDGFASTPQKPVPPKILPHSHHANLEFPFSILTKAMRRVMSDYGENILIKSPNSGCVELRETLRQYLARNRGIYIDTEQIIIGSGAEYLYTLIVGILGQEQIFALESPSYEKIEQVYQAAGITCDLLPLG